MKLLALAGFFLLACTRQPSFGELVTAASSRWEKAVCRTPQYSVMAYTPTILFCGGVPNENYWGCYTIASGAIEVSQKVPREKLLWVITHEMGHALRGFGGHVPSKKGLMAETSGTATPHITDEDIALVCEEIDCPCRNPEKP